MLSILLMTVVTHMLRILKKGSQNKINIWYLHTATNKSLMLKLKVKSLKHLFLLQSTFLITYNYTFNCCVITTCQLMLIAIFLYSPYLFCQIH